METIFSLELVYNIGSKYEGMYNNVAPLGNQVPVPLRMVGLAPSIPALNLCITTYALIWRLSWTRVRTAVRSLAVAVQYLHNCKCCATKTSVFNINF